MAGDHVGYSHPILPSTQKIPILPSAKIIDLAPRPFVIVLSFSHFRVLGPTSLPPCRIHRPPLLPLTPYPVQSLHI
jgi:hypothetical protein